MRQSEIRASGTPHAIELKDVTRRFARKWALRGVSLTVSAGEAVGVEGHNGSGKSTLLRVAATLLRPTSGFAALFGHDIIKNPSAARHLVGMLSHSPGLYEDLTARENLSFAAKMLGVPLVRVDEVLEHVSLAADADGRVREFSSGMQRRVALGRLMLRLPKVLLLDEPYNSFDPEGIALVNHVLQRVVEQGGAVLIVLHDRSPAERLLDRCVRFQSGVLRPAVNAVDAPLSFV